MIDYKCELCDAKFTTKSADDHARSHGFKSATEYFWKVVYKFEGDPICPTCGKSIIFNRYDRPNRYCNRNCWITSTELSESSRARLIELNKDPKFREDLIARSSELFTNLWKSGVFDNKGIELSNRHLDPEFVYNKLKSLGIDLDNGACVYLVRYSDKFKVGFSTDIDARLKFLGNPELISTVNFNDAMDALKLELEIHRKYKSKNLYDGTKDSSEMYPLELFDEINNKYFKK